MKSIAYKTYDSILTNIYMIYRDVQVLVDGAHTFGTLPISMKYVDLTLFVNYLFVNYLI